MICFNSDIFSVGKDIFNKNTKSFCKIKPVHWRLTQNIFAVLDKFAFCLLQRLSQLPPSTGGSKFMNFDFASNFDSDISVKRTESTVSAESQDPPPTPPPSLSLICLFVSSNGMFLKAYM